MIEWFSYDSNGKLKDKVFDEYDENNKKIKIIGYDSEGKIKYYYINTYDSKKNKTGYIEYDAEDHPKFKHELKYDDKGNLVENAFYGYYAESGYEEKFRNFEEFRYTYWEYFFIFVLNI